jgi:hypothetical protein
MKTQDPGVARVLKRLHYPLEVMLRCVRWYVAYPIGLRHLEEMMAERGNAVDHSTVRCWAIKLLPLLEKVFPVPKYSYSSAPADFVRKCAPELIRPGRRNTKIPSPGAPDIGVPSKVQKWKTMFHDWVLRIQI